MPWTIRKRAHILMATTLAVLLGGCSSLPDGHGWGQYATATPGMARVKAAAWGAATDPMTWGPALAAAGFALGDGDQRASEWAREHAPVFGSERDAQEASDRLRDTSKHLAWLTFIAAPSGADAALWSKNKLKALAVESAGYALSRNLTGVLKRGTDRTRPNGGDLSFPSAHSSSAAAYASMTRRHTELMALPGWGHSLSEATANTLALGTAWARVEAGSHYPTDAFAGVALGNFLTLFVYDAFMGEGQWRPRIGAVEGGGVEVGLTGRF